MRKEAAVVALGCAISAAIVLWSLSRTPPPPPPEPEESPERTEAPCPWWLTFEEEPIGCPSAVCQSLVWLLTRQNDDGTWGDGPVQLERRPLGKAGLTALAVLPFLGAGYTPLSKDVFPVDGGEWRTGDGIRKALAWLLRDQRDDGTFRSSADETFDQVLGAFALSETYGMTRIDHLKRPAQLAVDALLRMQKADGTWEGAGPTGWAIVTLYSARASKLAVDSAAVERTLRSPGYPGHPGHALARILRKDDARDVAWSLLQEGLDREPTNVAWWYLASLAVYAHDGPQGYFPDIRTGPQWTAWSPILKEKLVPFLFGSGTMAGTSSTDTIVRTSLLQLTMEIYYRYPNLFRPQ
ncbi:MAG TPA: prenyltransferase/squalene oxidase repeat-containing protein [Planctomycetota bacterium]|nr:prenyltransferase/squalene oxidase repeat-containing protein [Planctomycetota bacterium]